MGASWELTGCPCRSGGWSRDRGKWRAGSIDTQGATAAALSGHGELVGRLPVGGGVGAHMRAHPTGRAGGQDLLGGADSSMYCGSRGCDVRGNWRSVLSVLSLLRVLMRMCEATWRVGWRRLGKEISGQALLVLGVLRVLLLVQGGTLGRARLRRGGCGRSERRACRGRVDIACVCGGGAMARRSRRMLLPHSAGTHMPQ